MPRLVICVASLLAGSLIIRSYGAQNEPPASVKSEAVLPLARSLYASGQLGRAEEVLRKELSQASSHAEPVQIAGYLNLLTSIYRDSERYREALSTGLRYQRWLDDLGKSDSEVIAQRQEIAVTLAQVYSATGQTADAMAMLHKALALPSGARLSDALWEARTYSTLAQIAAERGEQDAARSAWLSVETAVRPVLDQATTASVRSTARQLLVESLVARNQSQRAIAVLEQALSQQRADDEVRSQILTEIADCRAKLNDKSGEIEALRSATGLMSRNEKLALSAGYADLLDRLGLAYQRKGDAARARTCWLNATAIFERLRKRAGQEKEKGIAEQIRCDQGLQRVYQSLGNWKKGVEVGQRLLENRKRTRMADDPSVFRTMWHLGACYCKLEDAAAARPLLEESLTFWRSRTPAPLADLAGTLNILAEACRLEGSYSEAVGYLEEALPIYQQLYPPDDLRLAELNTNLASLLAAKGQYKTAIERQRAAADICRRRAAG